EIEMNFTNAHVWDDSAVASIDKVIMKYEQSGVKVSITGLNERSAKLVTLTFTPLCSYFIITLSIDATAESSH
ncbi:hypothetical protein ACT453_61275, partial [Bacillus sp. D-CC]